MRSVARVRLAMRGHGVADYETLHSENRWSTVSF
jgi:hypothetical protein